MTKRIEIDDIRQDMLSLGLHFASEALPELVSESAKTGAAPHLLLANALRVEVANREERRIKTSLRLSGLPPGKTMGSFDFSFQPSVERSRIETLATYTFVRWPRPSGSRPLNTASRWLSTPSRISCMPCARTRTGRSSACVA